MSNLCFSQLSGSKCEPQEQKSDEQQEDFEIYQEPKPQSSNLFPRGSGTPQREKPGGLTWHPEKVNNPPNQETTTAISHVRHPATAAQRTLLSKLSFIFQPPPT